MMTSADDTIVEGVENRWLLPGETHRNPERIAAVDGNKWPLPEPRDVGRRAKPLHRFPMLRRGRPVHMLDHIGRRADDHC
ncbi:hypothetical protein ZWY2020_036925 [Hordeum vulgare]|nr:hypothetical protein ZWY2020_036925 [Hordeum vulgare]